MHALDYIVLAIVAVILFFAVRSSIRSKRSGRLLWRRERLRGLRRVRGLLLTGNLRESDEKRIGSNFLRRTSGGFFLPLC